MTDTTKRSFYVLNAQTAPSAGELFDAGIADSLTVTTANKVSDELPSIAAQRPTSMLNQEDPANYLPLGVEGGDFGSTADYLDSALILLGKRSGVEDKQSIIDNYDMLVQDIPASLHEQIVDSKNFDAALRTRSRIVAQMDNAQKFTTASLGGAAAYMLGSILPDLPIYVATGFSGLGARAAVSTGKVVAGMTGSAKLANIAGGAAAGAVSGAAGGAVEGALRMGVQETATEDQLILGVLGGAAFGGGLGGVAGALSKNAWADTYRAYKASVVDGTVSNGKPIDIGTVPVIQTIDEQIAKLHTVPTLDEFSIANPSTYAVPTLDEFTAQAAQAAKVNKLVSANDVPIEPAVVNKAISDSRNVATALDPKIPNTIDPVRGKLSTQDQAAVNFAKGVLDAHGVTERVAADKAAIGYQKVVNSIANSKAMNVATIDGVTFRKSKSKIANFIGSILMDSQTSLGRADATSSILREVYQSTMLTMYHTPIKQHFKDFANPIKVPYADKVVSTIKNPLETFKANRAIKEEFDKRVYMESNRRAQGLPPADKHPAIQKAVEDLNIATERAKEVLRGELGEVPVFGFDRSIPLGTHYVPQQVDSRKIGDLMNDGKFSKKELASAYRQALINSGVFEKGDPNLQVVADAYALRAVSKTIDKDTSLLGLLSTDGRDFLREALLLNEIPESRVDEIVRALTSKAEEKGKVGFAKRRNSLDLTVKVGKFGTRLVDIYNTDLDDILPRYFRKVAGNAALARNGIASNSDRKILIDALQAEQLALGEQPIPREVVESLFSHYDGGSVKGYMLGRSNDGLDPMHSALNKLTRLSLLNNVVFPQLGEIINLIAVDGLGGFIDRNIAPLFNKLSKADRDSLLDELTPLIGDVGHDHRIHQTSRDIEDMSAADTATYIKQANNVLAAGNDVQGHVSGFYSALGWQQKGVVTLIQDSVLTNVLHKLEKGTYKKSNFEGRAWGDFGFDSKFLSRLSKLVEDGTIEFKTSFTGRTYVNRLNVDKWDSRTSAQFARGIMRGKAQAVQGDVIGDSSAWVSTPTGAVVTQLKKFPLLAVQKQAMRNLVHSDSQSVVTLLGGMVTTGLALYIRDSILGRDINTEDIARKAFNYSNLTGWIPMYVDPVLTMAGLADYRLNNFGHYTEITPASVTTVNNLLRAPGAIAKGLVGEDEYSDRQAIKALPFANLWVLQAMLSRTGDK